VVFVAWEFLQFAREKRHSIILSRCPHAPPKTMLSAVADLCQEDRNRRDGAHPDEIEDRLEVLNALLN
jgi:hypothetical protein